MKAAQIRQMSTDELRSRVGDARQELMNLRFQVVTGQQTDTSQLKKTRRLIAQYETILRERELAEERGEK